MKAPARGRRLEDVAGGHDEVGSLAGLERADLIGDAQDLRRGQGHGLERRVLGKAERDGRRRLVGEVPAAGRRGGPAALGADRHRDPGRVQPRRVGVGRVVGIVLVRGRVQRAAHEHGDPRLLERGGDLPGLVAPEMTALSFSSLAIASASRISVRCSAWKITGFWPFA